MRPSPYQPFNLHLYSLTEDTYVNLRELPLSYMPQTVFVSLLVQDCLPATFTHHSLYLKEFEQSFLLSSISNCSCHFELLEPYTRLINKISFVSTALSPCWYFQGLQGVPIPNLNLDSSTSVASIMETTRTVVLNAIMLAPCIRLLDLFRGELYCYQ